MSPQFMRLYKNGDSPEDAYLLADGSAVFFVTEVDKYSIKGKNIIIGATELLLDRALDMKTNRLETALVDASSKVKKISGPKFYEGFSQVSFLLNSAMVLAKQVSLTNQIIARYEQSLKGKERDRQKICVEYYHIVRDIKEANEKRKLPWLKDFVTKYETTLIFREGESQARTAEPMRITGFTHLSDKMIEFPRDALLCEEEAEGTEMYILQSGMIDVLVHGTVVATYSDPGTPIGEIALLIGEKRTATLKAKNNVVVTRIRKEELREIAEREIVVVQGIAHSLAKKHFQNVHRIMDLTGKSVIRDLDAEHNPGRENEKLSTASIDLSELRNALSDLLFKKNEPFLKEITAKYLIE